LTSRIFPLEANSTTTTTTMCTLTYPQTSLLTYLGMGSPQSCGSSGRGRGWRG